MQFFECECDAIFVNPNVMLFLPLMHHGPSGHDTSMQPRFQQLQAALNAQHLGSASTGSKH